MINISLEATFPSFRVGGMTRPYYLRPGPTLKPFETDEFFGSKRFFKNIDLYLAIDGMYATKTCVFLISF